MTSVQNRGRCRRELLSIAFFDSFLPPQLDNKLSNQIPGPPRLQLAIVLLATLFVPKYTKKDLQWILKIILEV